MQLTTMDVYHLIKNPSSVSKDTLAEKVSAAFVSGSFNQKESSIAADILRLLLNDAKKSIRKTLSENLCKDENIPYDIIIKLAHDETDIAEDVLQYSPVLTDDDLALIIKNTREVLNLCAIARRERVSEYLSDMLISTEQEEVLFDLFNNKGAILREASLTKVWTAISSSNELLEALVKRGGLPLTIVDKIFTVVSNELKQQLVREYKISPHIAHKASVDAREWELLGILPVEDISHPDSDERVQDLVDQLYANGRLTHSLVIRALCMGFLNLFETSLARMADIPRANARILLMGGHEGFVALYSAASMPECFSEAVELLLGLSHKITKYGFARPHDFRKRLIESIYVGGYNNSVDNMGYLLSIIDGKISGSPTSFSIH